MDKKTLRSLIREEIQKELNESAEMIDATALLFPALGALFGISVATLVNYAGGVDIFSDDNRTVLQKLKDWWKSKKDNRVMNKIADRIKDDPEVQEFLKKPNKDGWQKMLASKLTPQEQQYITKLYRTRFK